MAPSIQPLACLAEDVDKWVQNKELRIEPVQLQTRLRRSLRFVFNMYVLLRCLNWRFPPLIASATLRIIPIHYDSNLWELLIECLWSRAARVVNSSECLLCFYQASIHMVIILAYTLHLGAVAGILVRLAWWIRLVWHVWFCWYICCGKMWYFLTFGYGFIEFVLQRWIYVVWDFIQNLAHV
jgi:hypothetical protein